MTTAISVPFAAAVLLLAAPAAAQVSQADPQAIARSLMDQGYADVRVIEDDGELAVSATRAGATRNFIHDRDSGQLVSSEDHEGDEGDEPGARDEDEGPARGEDDRVSPEAGAEGEGDGSREGDRGLAGNDDGGEDGGDEGSED